MYKIVLFPKIQIDTLIGLFLLKKFGENKFPGISEAPVLFWSELPKDKTTDELEAEGYILIDLGHSRFDHHRLGENNRTVCASIMIAEYLQIEDKPELKKLLDFARRDDLEGKGTLSLDPLDRSFGLSGLLSSMVKTASAGQSGEIVEVFLPILEGHYLNELAKYEQMPKEYEQLKQTGKLKHFNANQFGKILHIVYIESDNPGLAGFLRSRAVGADLVIQKAGTGHVNFITKQMLRLQLHKLAREIKLLEASLNNLILDIDNISDLEKPGRTEGLPHWYYDTRANTLQNGGMNPQDIPPTKLSYSDIEMIVKKTLNIARNEDKFYQPVRRHKGAIIID